MHQTYSSSVSPFQAKTGTPVAAMLIHAVRNVVENEQLRKLRRSGMILSGKDILKTGVG